MAIKYLNQTGLQTFYIKIKSEFVSVDDAIDFELSANKVMSIDMASSDDTYPSSKAVYEFFIGSSKVKVVELVNQSATATFSEMYGWFSDGQFICVVDRTPVVATGDSTTNRVFFS